MVELIVSFQFSYMDEKMPLFFLFLFSSNFTCICELLEKKYLHWCMFLKVEFFLDLYLSLIFLLILMD